MSNDTGHHNPNAHEPDAINVRGVLIASSILAIFVILSVWGTRWYEGSLRGEAPARNEEVRSPESGRHAARLTHWEDPAADLAELRAQEDERLSGYDWIDRDNEIVRIPIDRAMELLAEGKHGNRNRSTPTTKPKSESQTEEAGE